MPLQPPEAAQEVAFIELHVNIDAEPLLTVVCDAWSATEGGASTAGGGSTAGGLSLPPHAAISSTAPMVGKRIQRRMYDPGEQST